MAPSIAPQSYTLPLLQFADDPVFFVHPTNKTLNSLSDILETSGHEAGQSSDKNKSQLQFSWVSKPTDIHNTQGTLQIFNSTCSIQYLGSSIVANCKIFGEDHSIELPAD